MGIDGKNTKGDNLAGDVKKILRELNCINAYIVEFFLFLDSHEKTVSQMSPGIIKQAQFILEILNIIKTLRDGAKDANFTESWDKITTLVQNLKTNTQVLKERNKPVECPSQPEE